MTTTVGSRRGNRPERAKSRAQAAYEHLRLAIIRGTFRPNERLIEADLAEELDVSRTPIRESLHRLAAEGLVSPVRRGWIVRELTLDEMRDIYEVREALEGYAARLAAERATDEEIALINEMVARRVALTPDDGRDELVFSNDAFHEAIFLSSRNAPLIEQIGRFGNYYFNLHVASLYSEQELAVSVQQHSALADAISRRDGDAAEDLMRAHVREALRVLLAHAR